MDFLKNKNFSFSKLASGITDTATSLTITTDDNTLFPSTGNFMCVIWGETYSSPAADNSREIVEASFDTGDAYTIIREQEDTTKRAWDVNSNFALVVTAKKVDEIETEINKNIDIQNYADSPMIVTGGLVTDGTTAGTFKVSALTALLRTTDSSIGTLVYVTKALEDNITITSFDIIYYVILNYNSGTPTISISETLPNMTQNILIGKVLKTTNKIHYISCGSRLQDGVKTLFKRSYDLRNIESIRFGNSIICCDKLYCG